MYKNALLISGVVALLSTPLAHAQVYFSEDFNTGGTQGAIDRGWEFVENEFVTEVGSNFVVAPEWPEGQDGPGTSTGFINPPTADGTESDGGYLMADSDAGSGSDDVGSLAEIYALSPSFSTVGSGPVYFHADTEIENNNNGECVMFLEATIDDGATWIQVWYSVEGERVIDSFNTETDILGNPFDGSARTNGWPELGSGSLTKSFSGIHGRWIIQMPEEVENQPNVRFRVGYYEMADAWWIALDNIEVSSTPPPVGDTVLLEEDFENGIPSSWSNTNLATNADLSLIGEPQLWSDDVIIDPAFNEPFKLDSDGIPISVDFLDQLEAAGLTLDLENPDPKYNPKGTLDGRWLYMLGGQGYAMWQEGDTELPDGGSVETAALDTPSIDFSAASAAFMYFDSEVLVGSGSSLYEVHVSVDGGTTFERIWTYHEALMNYEEASYFTRHYFEIPEAAGQSDVIFRFWGQGQDPNEMEGFWAIDNVTVTADTGTPVPNWNLF